MFTKFPNLLKLDAEKGNKIIEHMKRMGRQSIDFEFFNKVTSGSLGSAMFKDDIGATLGK